MAVLEASDELIDSGFVGGFEAIHDAHEERQTGQHLQHLVCHESVVRGCQYQKRTIDDGLECQGECQEDLGGRGGVEDVSGQDFVGQDGQVALLELKSRKSDEVVQLILVFDEFAA